MWTTLRIEWGQAPLPSPKTWACKWDRLALPGELIQHCFCDRHGVKVIDIPAKRKLLLMGATAGISWVSSTHVVFPVGLCVRTTGCRYGEQRLPVVSTKTVSWWMDAVSAPWTLGLLDFWISSTSTIFSLVFGKGYRWRLLLLCEGIFEPTTIVSSSREQLSTEKQVDNQNRSESPGLSTS